MGFAVPAVLDEMNHMQRTVAKWLKKDLQRLMKIRRNKLLIQQYLKTLSTLHVRRSSVFKPVTEVVDTLTPALV